MEKGKKIDEKKEILTLQVCGPLVDSIGVLESRDVSLGDCTLELVQCAKHVFMLDPIQLEDADFLEHAKKVFTAEFRKLDTNLHWFVLFLHPNCRRLALSQKPHARSFNQVIETAVQYAEKWEWDFEVTLKLVENLNGYLSGEKPFIGVSKDPRKWWASLYVRADECPLKSMALILLSLVPHAADVERQFSSLGGTQGKRRTRLKVSSLEKLARMRGHYNNLLIGAKGGSTLHRTSACMEPVADEPSIAQSEAPESDNEGPETNDKDLDIQVLLSTTGEEFLETDQALDASIDKGFSELAQQEEEEQPRASGTACLPNLNEPLSGFSSFSLPPITPDLIYDFNELERVLTEVGSAKRDNLQIHHNTIGKGKKWTLEDVKEHLGLAPAH